MPRKTPAAKNPLAQFTTETRALFDEAGLIASARGYQEYDLADLFLATIKRLSRSDEPYDQTVLSQHGLQDVDLLARALDSVQKRESAKSGTISGSPRVDELARRLSQNRSNRVSPLILLQGMMESPELGSLGLLLAKIEVDPLVLRDRIQSSRVAMAHTPV